MMIDPPMPLFHPLHSLIDCDRPMMCDAWHRSDGRDQRSTTSHRAAPTTTRPRDQLDLHLSTPHHDRHHSPRHSRLRRLRSSVSSQPQRHISGRQGAPQRVGERVQHATRHEGVRHHEASSTSEHRPVPRSHRACRARTSTELGDGGSRVLVERSSSLDDRCRQPTDDSRVARCCDRHHTRTRSLACDRHHASRPQERERVDRRENESQGVGPRHCGSGGSLDVDQPRESQLSRSRATSRRSIHIEGRCLQSRSDDARDGDRRGGGRRSSKEPSGVGHSIVRRSRRRLEHESLSVVDIVDQAMCVGGGRSTTELSRRSRGAREDQGSMARSIRVMWRSAKDRGTNDNNCNCNDINNRRRIRNMVKQLDEIGRDRDPQVVSMIVFFLASSCLVEIDE